MEILNLVLTYEVDKGHLKWKVSDVSRKLKVSRSLIYYHFGKAKESILDSCYQIVAEEFYGLKKDMRPLRACSDEIMAQALRETQAIYLNNSAIVVFFHRWRFQPGDVQTRVLGIEKQFRAKLQATFPELSGEEVLALHTLMHGAVTSPFTGIEAMRIVAGVINQFLRKRFKPAPLPVDE